MKDCKVKQLIYKTFQEKPIEVNGSQGKSWYIIEWIIIVKAYVVAYIRTNLILDSIKWIFGDCSLECLDYGVNNSQSLVFKD